MTPQGVAGLQTQARALGDRTRYAIFRFIADTPGEVGIAELTAHLGLNHNAIRQHVAKLCEAGLVVEGKARPSGARGRPRLVYRVDPAADSRWGVVGPYERLSVLLAEMLRSGARAVDVGRRSAIATTAAPVTGDPIAAVADAMAREGFDPVVFRHKGDAAEIVLQTCPFVAAAEADPATVCALHLGIAEGVAEATGGRLRIDRLVPHDPRRANCRLHVHVEDGDGDV